MTRWRGLRGVLSEGSGRTRLYSSGGWRLYLLHFKKSHFFICQPWHIIHTMVRLSVSICPSLRIEHLLRWDWDGRGKPGPEHNAEANGRSTSSASHPSLAVWGCDSLLGGGGSLTGGLVTHAARFPFPPQMMNFSGGEELNLLRPFVPPSAGPSPEMVHK